MICASLHLKSSFSSILKPEIKTQYALRHAVNNFLAKETIEWCAGMVVKVSNRSNLMNPRRRPQFHKKDKTVEVQWEANSSKGKETSYYALK